MNKSKSPGQRANLLLDASTLEQQMRWLNEASANETNLTVFGSTTYPAQVACAPFTADTDGPMGIAYTPGVTAFPIPMAQAASWDERLTRAKGKAEADEAFRKRYDQLLGPAVDIVRSPWAGRNGEYLGEDPLLSGTLAGDWINALRNGNPGEPVAAVVKHYLGNNQEIDRSTSSSNIDDRTLHEVYSLPFAIANSIGHPAGVMCSYNQVNGKYACENPELLNGLLKKEIGFKGFVVTDNGSQHSTAASLNAGLDQELSLPKYFAPDKLHAALDAGEITKAQIRAAAFRVIRAKIANGLFDNPLPAVAQDNVRTDAHDAVALKMAEEGSVLLQNRNQILPLTLRNKTIAIIGPTASNTPTAGVSASTVCTSPLYGDPSAPNAVQCPNPVAPLDALTARAARNHDTVIYDDGSDVKRAARTAAQADTAIVFGYNVAGEYFDLPSLNVANNGDALIEAVAGANRHTIVDLETAGPVLTPWADKVQGIVESWYPGEAQGDALAGLLFGNVNFTGKLPVTFPKSIADLPTGAAPNAQYPGTFAGGSTTRTDPEAIRQVAYSEGLKVGYKWYDAQHIAPQFAFGFGLSYTKFAYSRLAVSTHYSSSGALRSTVSFNVTNTGRSAGAEVSQVYLTLPGTSGEPGKRLVSFKRQKLTPGETQRVRVVIDSSSSNRPFSVWDSDTKAWRIPGGKYAVSVGSSSRDLPLSRTWRIGGHSK
ncbi:MULTISPECIES: beta-glucosidase [unclassified Frondihabitans]|uniref:beta-glucosidase family protein n=1 Tax=unclassified Frondihabitans TaxID=2626248 RepID=UPI000F4E2582|nr:MULTISPECIES: glycoside hydrolase family 3 C-terminal domain-containing protein [unclassified Frondihabitans]